MNDIVMVDFFRRHFAAQFQPDAMQEIDLLRRQVRSVRTEIKDLVLPGRKIELKRQLRFGIRQPLPRQSGDTRLLNHRRDSAKRPTATAGRLQALCSAQDGIPFIGRRRDSQMDGLSLFLGDLESAREELLLFETEKLFVGQFVFAAARALQESQMKDDDVLRCADRRGPERRSGCRACCSFEPSPEHFRAARRVFRE